MTRKINNSYELGQTNAPTDGGDMLKTRTDGTLVWEGVDDTTYEPSSWYGNRGVFGGGSSAASGSSGTNIIGYITIATPANASDFGDLTVSRGRLGICSDGTKGVFGGGFIGSGDVNTIDYITIATTGDALDFGDLTVARNHVVACSDGTKGVWGGGYDSATSNIIDYITIATTSNALDFGDLTVSRTPKGACSNDTKSIMQI